MRIIREYIPFLMLGVTLLSAVLSHFDFYVPLEVYLSDLVGYSVLTNLFMLAVYHNSRYCLSTILSVYALLLMNIINMVLHGANLYSQIYDFYITVLISLVVFTVILTNKCYYKLKK